MISAKPIKGHHMCLSSLQASLGEGSFAISLTCFMVIFQTRRYENPTANLESPRWLHLAFCAIFVYT